MTPRTKSTMLYIGLTVLFVASYALAATLPAEAILRQAAASTGICALVGALFQLFRDSTAFDRQLQLKRDEQQFQIGVTSHMSNVVFDKHVLFCEEYMSQLHATVENLIREHATGAAITHANLLYSIRRKYAAWITEEMSGGLSAFEDAVRKMGAQAHFVEVTADHPQYAEQRIRAIESVYSEFERQLPQYFGRKPEAGVGSEAIEARVRELLGIERLVELRTTLIVRAHSSLSISNRD
jgi:hypothetical protein